ncbi:hypothetical protein [Burkholderia ubonensis]|uniref:hypothetical protein n=1 Tax=Burkholderia ubonensis TaxID=101571 RepID=UPI00114CB9EF|nr:hypothetical protein [Burkholderia ubonensis]
MQAGDRLLTREVAPERYAEYDANSNKSLVYEASDGLIFISYSGKAFIGEQPTDEWLAHALHPSAEHMYDRKFPDPSAIGTSNDKRLSVNEVIKMLRALLRDIDIKTVQHHGVALTMAGWRVTENRPFLIEIRRFKDSSRMKVSGFKRRFGVKANCVISLIGSGNKERVDDYLSAAWEEVHRDASLSHREASCAYEHAVRTALIDTIRFASAGDKSVGTDVHIATMGKPVEGRIFAETHFASDTPHPATIILPPRDGVERMVEVEDSAVTGWLLMPDRTFSPSYLVGEVYIGGALSHLRLVGEGKQGNVRTFFQSIKRRRD